MNIQMMEGLVGANTSLKMSGTPMSVYRQAGAEGDTEKMKRALGYTGECTEKAVQYQEKLDEGMTAEAKAKREKAKLEWEAAIEERREERRRTEAETGSGQKRDAVAISEAAKAALAGKTVEAAPPIEDGPAIYTKTGETALETETASAVSFLA